MSVRTMIEAGVAEVDKGNFCYAGQIFREAVVIYEAEAPAPAMATIQADGVNWKNVAEDYRDSYRAAHDGMLSVKAELDALKAKPAEPSWAEADIRDAMMGQGIGSLAIYHAIVRLKAMTR